MIPTYFAGGVSMEGAKWDSVDDPYWASTTLLLRMNGSEGSETFNDSSSFGREVLATLSDFWVTAEQSKSGGTSCRCNGDGGRLRATNTSATELTGDFTIEAWVYWQATPAAGSSPFGVYKTGPTNLNVQRWTDNKLYTNESGDKITGTTTVTDNTWHHIALTRTGTTVRMWFDGVQEGSTWTSSSTYAINGNYTYIGSASDGGLAMGASTADGYIDLVRVTKADRYGTASFTPPDDY